ncbi:DNA topoisomerase VI subunit B, partial [Candidatus Woesearchaeota archaeon]|nr:DNA topoisomerase VI subunit B [Candidatus Woesearchaeota archaeon]
NMIKYMSLFLLQFGIFCRVNKANNDLRLIVSGENNVKRFYEEIGFYHSGQENKLKKIIKNGHLDTKHSQIERVPFISKQLMSLRNRLSLKNSDFVYSHIFSRNRPISYPILFSTYKTFMSKIKDKKIPIELQELYCLLNSDIIFVPVIKKSKSESREPFVYDLTMLHGNNFIANGVLVHNSASVLYGQLTTSKPVRITSRISPKKPTHYYELHIDIAKNEPEIVVDKEITWMKDHGTKVEIELEGKYQKGRLGVDEYLKQTAIANPHLNLVYINPLNEKVEFKKVTNELPKEPKEIKPHPYGIELGILVRMLRNTESRNLRSFLTNEFSRVSNAVADEIINKAALKPEVKPKDITHKDADKIFKVIQQTKIMAPPTDCLSPISEELLLKGLKKEVTADFYATVSRSPAVYRGIPFQVEVAIAYGGSSLRQDELVRLIRFANRVPLIYQQSACAITKSVVNTDWKNYGLQQSKGALPSGPAVIVLHIASVWVPFTSESKEAIAHYPEIIKEIKLALQEVGRKLNAYIRKNVRVKEAKERVSLFEKYIPEVADALAELTRKKKSNITADLQKILKKGLPELMAQANGEQTNDKGKK